MFAVQVSGTGHAGMEATIANCLEPGETIVVATSGIWGQRVCDLSERYGGNTHYSHQSNTHGLVICQKDVELNTHFSHTKKTLRLGIWGQRVCDLSERYEITLTCHTKATQVGLSYLHGNAGMPVDCNSGIWGQRVCDLSERYAGNT